MLLQDSILIRYYFLQKEMRGQHPMKKKLPGTTKSLRGFHPPAISPCHVPEIGRQITIRNLDSTRQKTKTSE